MYFCIIKMLNIFVLLQSNELENIYYIYIKIHIYMTLNAYIYSDMFPTDLFLFDCADCQGTEEALFTWHVTFLGFLQDINCFLCFICMHVCVHIYIYIYTGSFNIQPILNLKKVYKHLYIFLNMIHIQYYSYLNTKPPLKL